MTDPVGLSRGLTHYGDRDFALYLRRSFARSMGYSTAMLEKPVIGIVNTLVDGGTVTPEQRATLRQIEADAEAKLVGDINKDLAGGG